MVYIKFASKTVNIEIDFYQQNINKTFHFALFAKKDGILLTIMLIFLYLCSHEKESDNSIIYSSYNIWL
jgi:hypothetical protein